MRRFLCILLRIIGAGCVLLSFAVLLVAAGMWVRSLGYFDNVRWKLNIAQWPDGRSQWLAGREWQDMTCRNDGMVIRHFHLRGESAKGMALIELDALRYEVGEQDGCFADDIMSRPDPGRFWYGWRLAELDRSVLRADQHWHGFSWRRGGWVPGRFGSPGRDGCTYWISFPWWFAAAVGGILPTVGLLRLLFRRRDRVRK